MTDRQTDIFPRHIRAMHTHCALKMDFRCKLLGQRHILLFTETQLQVKQHNGNVYAVYDVWQSCVAFQLLENQFKITDIP